MLKAFFEYGCSPQVFEGLEIARETELCEKYMGKFPVISISLKDVCADSYPTARRMLIKTIKEEALRQKKKDGQGNAWQGRTRSAGGSSDRKYG